jgi:hypothetical protein
MPAELQATEEAFEQLSELRKDPRRKALRVAVEGALAALEDDPTQDEVRGIRFVSNPAIWGIGVRTRDDDWLILWEMSAPDPAVVFVRYIGPRPS